MPSSPSSAVVISPDQLLDQWLGHRRLTRRTIDAFPEQDLFKFSVGGMRPFAELAMEMVRMAAPTLQGVVEGVWESSKIPDPTTRAELLATWDQTTTDILEWWPRIPLARFQEVDVAFGQWKMPIYGLILYIIDNEIHHRGQGTVYLRALGIDPPAFYDRS